MRKLRPYIWPFVWSVAIATILASVFSTQFVISGLSAAGADLSFAQRLSMTGTDMLSLGWLYGVIIAVTLLFAFLAADRVTRFVKFGRAIVYTTAGVIGFLVMLFLMRTAFFDVQFIAGARSGLGLAFQLLAGGTAGYVFARMTRNLNTEPKNE